MGSYFVDEAVFQLPDVALADRTIHVLESRAPGEDDIGLFVQREERPRELSLLDVVAAELARQKAGLGAFAVLFEEESTADDRPVIEVGTRWLGPRGTVYQRLAFVGLSAQWMLFGVNAPLPRRAAADATMLRILETIRFRDGF
jgi:hypothetical protein